MKPAVVDASTAVKWFLPEVHAEAARRLLGGGYALMAPDLLFPEAANVLWKRVRKADMTADEASATLRALGAVKLQVAPSWPLALSALDLACRTGRTACDRLYLALAVRDAGVVVTADERLYNALAAGPMASYVLWVEDLE